MSELKCRRLPDFDVTDWKSIDTAFAGAEPLALQQSWRQEPEPEFLPAEVKTGWTDEALWIYATLQDVDIFNDATEPNQPTWNLGDVLELFLQAQGKNGAYYEIHVTPENQTMQLLWPDTEAVKRVRTPHSGEGVRSYFLSGGVFESRTLVEPGVWRVLAKVPVAMLYGCGALAGQQCRYSFCRYDITRKNKTRSDRKQDKEVLSSTSPHQKVDFHRYEEWLTLVFDDGRQPTK